MLITGVHTGTPVSLHMNYNVLTAVRHYIIYDLKIRNIETTGRIVLIIPFEEVRLFWVAISKNAYYYRVINIYIYK